MSHRAVAPTSLLRLRACTELTETSTGATERDRMGRVSGSSSVQASCASPFASALLVEVVLPPSTSNVSLLALWELASPVTRADVISRVPTFHSSRAKTATGQRGKGPASCWLPTRREDNLKRLEENGES